ncbi:MAG: hypothetical protein JG764_592 [Clostridiales bacterium]|jgi:2-oxoglutarate dehydrogenase complex dehydrogenase (E1) component-like enzyme|nr:hypothetical protein [Clostridiales bacterium]
MEFFFIVIGIILILLTYQEVLANFKDKETNNAMKVEKLVDEKLEILNAKVDLLAESLENISHQIKLQKAETKSHTLANVPPGMSFSRTMKREINNKEYEKMYEEYQKGVSVTEIARKFNRGKGEVELILSLKK